jgi:pyridoxal phosphate enzyme (YggS family)
MTSRIATNLEKVRENILRSAEISRRKPSDITLVVVSKKQPIEILEEAISAGINKFGENYPEEAIEKMGLLRHSEIIEWHMIGHLQSRKARIMVENFSMLHALDSLQLAEKLNRILGEVGKKLPVLLECNVSGEGSKFGWKAENQEDWENIAADLSRLNFLENLLPIGLMTMPPLTKNVEEVRPYFRKLKELRNFLSYKLDMKLPELSIGTSIDYEIAIQEGSTYIRVGQAILGSR